MEEIQSESYNIYIYIYIFFFLLKNKQIALARWLGWLERHPVHQKSAGSIAGHSTYT